MAYSDTYKNAYYFGATKIFYRYFQPVRKAATFVYTSVGSGAVGATSGQVAVSKFAHKEFHYQVPVLNSGSVAIQVEGRADFTATFSQLRRILVTAKSATWPLATIIPQKVDWMRVGIRAASPAASDLVSVYGIFR